MPVRARRPRYADVVGTLALVLALGTGGAYAATHLPKNSVTSKQVKNGSLIAKDFKKGQLKAGPQGPQGLSGAAGPNVLAAKATATSFNMSTACNSSGYTGPTITVKQAAILYVSTNFSWTLTGSAAHTLSTTVTLTQGATQVASMNGGFSSTPGEIADVQASGLMGASGSAFVLQPNVAYRVEGMFNQVTGACPGTPAVGQQISYLAFPAPTS